MTIALVHHSAGKPRNAVKGPIAALLKARSENPETADMGGLTIGEIVRALDLDKTRNGDVAAALIKLRSEGLVSFETGPATSTLGPRFVKRYRWKAKKTKPASSSAPAAVDDRRFISLCR